MNHPTRARVRIEEGPAFRAPRQLALAITAPQFDRAGRVASHPERNFMIVLPSLPYATSALEPIISETTMATHHGKHHAAYVAGVNSLLGEGPIDALEAVIRNAKIDEALFNNAAQAWNHAFFWNCMATRPSSPAGGLARAIDRAFGDLAALRAAFIDAGRKHFGSGWVWLVRAPEGLAIFTTHDAQTALTRDVTPLLVCDLWEHAYYLDYKNDRGAYLGQWWDRLANWDFAARQFAAATSGQAWTYPLQADSYVAPIEDHGAFEHALEEAGMLLDHAQPLGSEHRHRFSALLGRIAQYEPLAPPIGSLRRVSDDLDRRIREAARLAEEGHPSGDHNWDPLLGGDLAWRA
jgi:Fe-Mn family superoxide dismutase